MYRVHFRMPTLISFVVLSIIALAACGTHTASTFMPPASDLTGTQSEAMMPVQTSTRRTDELVRLAPDGNSAYSALVLADRPLAYYQLNDKSDSLVDSAALHIDGRYGSDVAHNVNPLTQGAGSASGFPGGSTVDHNGFAYTAPNASLQPVKATLEAWIEFNTPTPLKTHIPIIAYGDATGVGYGLYLEGTANNVDRLYYQQHNKGASGTIFFHGLTHLNPGVIYHVVAVFDGAAITTYINGLYDEKVAYPGTISYKGRLTVGLQIGGEKADSSFNGSLAFPGSIAQVAVYGYPLSQQVILNHFLTGQLLPKVKEAAIATDAFVDSVGMNVHFTYDHAAYDTQFSQVKSLLLASGIRHYRDDMSFNPGFVNFMKQLSAAGLHGTYVTKPTYTEQQIVGYPALVGSSFEDFESPNEPDDAGVKDWLKDAVAFHEKLYSWIKATPTTAAFPVLGPGLAWPHDYEQLGNLSNYLDEGNFHDYMGAYNPGFLGGPWNGMLAMLADARVSSGDKPIVSTEAGYGTLNGGVTVDYRTDLRYITRMFFEQFRAGISRTYSFEFLDETFPSGFKTYGIVDAGLTPKPSYNGITAILHDLADPGPAFSPSSLSLSISGLSTVHHLLMQRRNGSFVLAIWLEVPSWDVTSGQDISVPDQTVTLSTDHTFSAASEQKMDENGRFSVTRVPITGQQMSLDVSDKVSLVELTP